ncbi:hypothetical protein [Anaerotalea alkaliphila]|uniref:Uncharacterized protein n=1 Tax=Anaerotalea alkaliphila TaxID=2662126 RepID=A0A7X5HUW7_9FIRM|nr:hypothetical protein [Anaerotalea alkaliphila]NDL67116.1 hypothetical protein [Anaerotalea alkaliphila]
MENRRRFWKTRGFITVAAALFFLLLIAAAGEGARKDGIQTLDTRIGMETAGMEQVLEQPEEELGEAGEIRRFIGYFHFNYLFQPDNGTGAISPRAMQLFAVSYIYQHANQDLVFDTTEFMLRIPYARLEEVVERFFGVEFHAHSQPEGTGVQFVNGEYLMPAMDLGWTSEIVLDGVSPQEDGSNLAEARIIDPESGETRLTITAGIRKVDGRWIMESYRNAAPAQE